MTKKVVLLSALTLLAAITVFAADQKETTPAPAAHTMYAPADIQWTDAPTVLPSGAKAAVLEGDPAKPGYFAMRLKVPNGYKIMPHWHPNVERITVISGMLNMGLGDKFDETKGHAMTAGSYGSIQPKVHHYAWATGETEFQITTLGPWKLVYVDPKDDPSKK